MLGTRSHPDIAVTVVPDGAGVVVLTAGELDRATAPILALRLADVVAMGRSPLTIDLSGISFADVGGYRALAEFADTCRRRGLANHWAHPSSSVRLLWSILGTPDGTVLNGHVGCRNGDGASASEPPHEPELPSVSA